MAITAPGLASNLDVNGIVSQLMTVESRPLALYDTKEAKLQSQLSAYGSIKGAVSTFQSAMRGLSSLSRFEVFTANSTDSATVVAGAGSSAVAGSYAVEVTALAQAQKLTAAGQATTTGAIGSGATTTLSFDFGAISGGSFDSVSGTYSGASFTSSGSGLKTVSIDSSNNTLAGIRDAINNAKIGVTASIVNDGSATPYRLLISGNSSGISNSVKISVSGDAALSSLLAHDPAATQHMSEAISARNAALKVDGVTVTSASNTISEAIPGVTLILQKTNAGSPLKVNVDRDTTQITSAVNTFAKTYNDLNRALGDLSAYNAATKKGAVLNGDATVRALQSQLRATINSDLTGLTGNYTTLSTIGVSFLKDGTMAVDAARLQSAIDTGPRSIGALFAVSGTPTDSLIRYSAATSATKPGNYAVSVSQLATKGQLLGSAPAALTIYAGTNDALNVTLGGVSATITLAPGVYASASALATEVQSRINGAPAFAASGGKVTVTESAGIMTLVSNDYGATGSIAITGGNARDDLLGIAPLTTTGLDAAGSINGAAATGAGQSLSGASGDGSEGLKLDILGGATGARGSVGFSKGLAYRLEALAGSMLEDGGALNSRTDGIGKSIQDIGNQRDAVNRRLVDVEKRYRAQFTALDAMVSRMNQTSAFLKQQLAVQNNSNSNN